MIIRHEERNGQIVPVSAEIENEKEVEFLLEQLRPKGEWTISKEWRFDHYVKHYVCNRCITPAPHNAKSNFCSFCGADMRPKGDTE